MQRAGATEGRRGRANRERIPALLPEPAGSSEMPVLLADPLERGDALTLELAEARAQIVRLGETLAAREAALERHSLLAREADQRVRYSLQLVTSVLTMQAAAAPGQIEGRALVQASNRVQAIAHAHGLLHRAGGGELLAINDYLASLCSDLRQSLLVDGRQRRLDLDVEPLQLRAECAVALALIVNELVTNAFRHAFRERRQGRVLLEVRRVAPDRLRLAVSDDGVGLRDWKMRGRASGLGARIVGAMLQQLGGKLEVAVAGGTRFTLEVPIAQPDGALAQTPPGGR